MTEIDQSEYAGFFKAELEQASKLIGRKNIFVGKESESRKYGIELPFVLQYILQSNVLLMEQVLLIAGKPASHKSSFAFELARWVIQQGGFARLYETEGKFNPQLALSILGEYANERTWQVRACESLDSWVGALSKDIKLYRKMFFLDHKPKRGEKRLPLLPACMIVDSLTGKTTENNIEIISKDGKAANTQGMLTAKAINDWLQAQNFMYMPWYILLIRHEKQGGMDSAPRFGFGAATKQTPGGAAPDFIGAIDLRFSVTQKQRLSGWGYNIVQIKCKKNAFGVDNLRCGVRFSWRWQKENEAENPVQMPRWEWNLAAAELLADFDRASIKDICHVVRTGSKSEPRFSCKQLGLKEVTGEDFGLALKQDEGIYKALQDYLHIERRQIFDPNMEIPDD